MEPLNQVERKKAVNRFYIYYGLSLLLVLLATYFLFNTPAGIFKRKIRDYKATEAEQAGLLKRISGMTVNLQQIIGADEKYLNSNNELEKGSLLGSLQEYQKNINDGLVDLKNDSATFASSISKEDSYNYISLFNTMLVYRNTIASLQKSLDAHGGDASELLKMKSQLDLCNQQLEICKMLANKPAPAAPAGGGGGGDKSKEIELQKQLDKALADLTACQKAKPGAPAPVVVTPTGPSGETVKATDFFDAGQDVYATAEKTKNLLERRGMLSVARQLMQKAAPAYPDKDKLNKTISQIELELKKLSNMS